MTRTFTTTDFLMAALGAAMLVILMQIGMGSATGPGWRALQAVAPHPAAAVTQVRDNAHAVPTSASVAPSDIAPARARN